jgi:hypothetical protein
MMVTRKSELTGKINHREMNVTDVQISNRARGVTAKSAYPELDSDEIAFIETGVTAEEFDAAWEGLL